MINSLVKSITFFLLSSIFIWKKYWNWKKSWLPIFFSPLSFYSFIHNLGYLKYDFITFKEMCLSAHVWHFCNCSIWRINADNFIKLYILQHCYKNWYRLNFNANCSTGTFFFYITAVIVETMPLLHVFEQNFACKTCTISTVPNF